MIFGGGKGFPLPYYRKSHALNGAANAGTDYQVTITAHYSEEKYITGWLKDPANPLLDPGNNKVWPAIVYNNATFHLYMGHYTAGSDITYWTSANGQNFTQHPSSPVITRAQVAAAWGYAIDALEPHSVIWFGNEWKLYFCALLPSSVWKCGCAHSADLVSWTVYNPPVIEPSVQEGNAADPHAVIFGGKVYVFYCSTFAEVGTYWQICSAVSDDGRNFTKLQGGTSYIIKGYAPTAFVALEGGITGLIHDVTWSLYETCAVWTTDALGFMFYPNNPVISHDPGITWESLAIGHGDICKVGDTYYLYYVGVQAGTEQKRIGRASTTTISIPSDSDDDVYLNCHCRSDFGDIRFAYDNSGVITALNFCILEKVDGLYANFFIRVKDDLSQNQTIYIYYGKLDETTTSNPFTTYHIYDDFADGVLNPLWVFEKSIGSVAEQNNRLEFTHEQNKYCHVQRVGLPPYFEATGWLCHNANPDEYTWGIGFHIWFNAYDWGNVHLRKGVNKIGTIYDINGSASLAEAGSCAQGTWYKARIRCTPSKVYFHVSTSGVEWTLIKELDRPATWVIDGNSLLILGHGYEGSPGSYPVLTLNNDGGSGATFSTLVDDVRVRKYVDPEPTHGGWGPEQPAGWPF